jgi:hypothetical protein
MLHHHNRKGKVLRYSLADEMEQIEAISDAVEIGEFQVEVYLYKNCIL